EADKEDDES
ncbi:hypothetical protein Tco_1412953, partial [Tanacetum coccineum]